MIRASDRASLPARRRCSSSRRPSLRYRISALHGSTRIADRLGERGTTGDATERFRQPCLHRHDQWSTALLAHAPALLGGLATDLVLNLVERGNLAQGFLGERRLSGGIDVIELASRMALMPSSA